MSVTILSPRRENHYKPPMDNLSTMMKFLRDYRGHKGGGSVDGKRVVTIGSWNVNIYVDMLPTGIPGEPPVEGLKDWKGSFDGRWDLNAHKAAGQDVMLGGAVVELELVDVDGKIHRTQAMVGVKDHKAVEDVIEGTFSMECCSGKAFE